MEKLSFACVELSRVVQIDVYYSSQKSGLWQYKVCRINQMLCWLDKILTTWQTLFCGLSKQWTGKCLLQLLQYGRSRQLAHIPFVDLFIPQFSQHMSLGLPVKIVWNIYIRSRQLKVVGILSLMLSFPINKPFIRVGVLQTWVLVSRLLRLNFESLGLSLEGPWSWSWSWG